MSIRTHKRLALAVLLALPIAVQAQFTYTTNNGAITITGYTGSGGAVTIPGSTNGWPVTRVGPGAFLNKTILTSLTFPDSLLSISNSAFSGCSGLTNVSFGAKLEYIGSAAFQNCGQLGSLSFPNSLLTIAGSAFHTCGNLTNLAFGTNLTSVGSAAFQYCSGLREVIIPNAVTNIGSSAFASCNNLTNLILGRKVALIGSSAFSSCSRLTTAIFPASVTNIGSSAFASCGNLTGAFFQTNAPSGDGTIFSGDTKATAYYLAGTTGWSSIFGGIMTMRWDPALQCGYTINSGTAQIARYLGSGGAIDIPGVVGGATVTGIDAQAFKNAVGLTRITLPDTLTRISSASFSGSGLTNVTIPPGVTTIGSRAFGSCASLRAIAVDPANTAYASLDGVLFDKALNTLLQCPGGKTGSCVIPATVTNIASGALSPCLLLASIEVDPLNPVYSSLEGVLLDQPQQTLLQYPQGKPGSYSVPASVTNIADYAFASSTALTGLTIGDAVLSLGGHVCEGCGALTNVSIGNGVTMLSAYAFNGCGNLVSATLGANMSRLGQAAFQLCGKLTNISLPATLTVIDSWVFNQCRALPSINIPNVVTIGDYAFNLCQALQNLYLPNLASLGVDVFGGCTSLATITFGPSLTYLSDWTFNSCHSLTSVYFCGNRPGYGSYVFAYANTPVVYYLAGTAGWGATFNGVPTALWRPSLQTSGPGFGVGFNISWAPGQTVVVEACTDPSSPIWAPLATNTLTSNSIFFSDPEYVNYPARFYRVRSP